MTTAQFLTCLLVRWLKVSAADARHVCQALQASRWSKPRALWDHLRAATNGADMVHLIQRQMPPQQLVAVVELLVTEGRLHDAVAGWVIECILAETAATGGWI